MADTKLDAPPDDLIAPPPDIQPAPKQDGFAERIRDLGEHSRDGQVSTKGAMDQMQTMPGTQADPGFGVVPARANTPEEHNRVGTDYANALKSHYGDETLASIAYNAGPGKLNEWLQKFGDPRKGQISMADFLAKIPYQETRDYAQRVAPPSDGPPADLIGPPADLIHVADHPPKDIGAGGEFAKGMREATAGIGKTLNRQGVTQGLIQPSATDFIPGVAAVKALLAGIGLMGTAPPEEPTKGSGPLDFKGPLDLGSVGQKLAHGAGQTVPVMLGASLGGIPGAAITAYEQTYGQKLEELQAQNPANPGQNHAIAAGEATVDAAATALGWKLFEYTPLKGIAHTAVNDMTGEVSTVYKKTIGHMIGNIAAQGLAIQPAVALVNQGINNLIEGRPLTEGMPEQYVQGGMLNTLMMGFTHLLHPPGLEQSPWRKPGAGEFTPYDPGIHGDMAEPIEPGGGPRPAPNAFRPGAQGRLTGPLPKPPDRGEAIGVQFPDGSVRRAEVLGYGAAGKTVYLRYEDGETAEHLTSEVLRDRRPAPPATYEPSPEVPKPYQRQLGPDEGRAPPFGEAPPDGPGSRAAAKIAGRQPQQVLDPQAIHTLDLADRLEQAATDPMNPMSTADRMASLMQVSRLRQQFMPQGEESRPAGYRHPTAGEPSRDLGELGAARATNPEIYETPGESDIVSRRNRGISDALQQMPSAEQPGAAAVLQWMSRSLNEELAQNPPPERRAEIQGQLQELRQRLQAARQAHPGTLPGLRGEGQPNASPGLWSATQSGVALPGASPYRPQDLLQFLGARGGLRPDDPYVAGNLQAMDADKKFLPGIGKLVRKEGGIGVSIEEARRAAAEAGYGTGYNNFETTDDLLDAIRDQLAGKDVFSHTENGGIEAAQNWQAHKQAERIGPEQEREDRDNIEELRHKAEHYGIPVGEDWSAEDLMAAVHEREAVIEDRKHDSEADDRRLADIHELNFDHHLAVSHPEVYGHLRGESVADEDPFGHAEEPAQGQPATQPEAAAPVGEHGGEGTPGKETGPPGDGGHPGDGSPVEAARLEAEPAEPVERPLIEALEETPAARKDREGKRRIEESQQLPRAHKEKVQKPADEGLFTPEPLTPTGDLVRLAEENVNPEPSAAQIAAGNYKQGHTVVESVPITIETASGQVRRGVGPDGKPWAKKLKYAYGKVDRTEGADGEQIDVHIGPHLDSPDAFVIDQIEPATGDWDEHKGVMGARTEEQAREIYNSGFSDGSGPDRLGAITAMPVDEFKEWAQSGPKREPLAYREPIPQAPAAPTVPLDRQAAEDMRAAKSTPPAAADQSGDGIEEAIDEAIPAHLEEALEDEHWRPASETTAEPQAAGRPAETGEPVGSVAGEAKGSPAPDAKPAGGGHPAGEGAATREGERPVDGDKKPIFKEGERVVIGGQGEFAGRHGTISNVTRMLTTTLFMGRGMAAEKTSHHYEVKTDEGTQTYGHDLTEETERPAKVVKDPVWREHPIHPDALRRTIEYAKKSEERHLVRADRARKAENIKEAKDAAANSRREAEEAAKVLAAWERQNQDLAKVPETAIPPTQIASSEANQQSTGAKVTENKERNGVEVRFPGRPPDEVIGKLKAAGFRWSRPQKLWYAKRSDRTLAVANGLKGGAEPSKSVEIRQEPPVATPPRVHISRIDSGNHRGQYRARVMDGPHKDVIAIGNTVEQAKVEVDRAIAQRETFTTTPGAIAAEHAAEVSSLEAEGTARAGFRESLERTNDASHDGFEYQVRKSPSGHGWEVHKFEIANPGNLATQKVWLRGYGQSRDLAMVHAFKMAFPEGKEPPIAPVSGAMARAQAMATFRDELTKRGLTSRGDNIYRLNNTTFGWTYSVRKDGERIAVTSGGGPLEGWSRDKAIDEAIGHAFPAGASPTETAANTGAAEAGRAELDAAVYQPAAMPITSAAPPPKKPVDLFSIGDAVQPKPEFESDLPPRSGARYVTNVSPDGRQVTLDGGAILPSTAVEPTLGHGLQEPVRPGAAGSRPETVSGIGEDGKNRPAPAGEESGGTQPAGRPSGAGAKGTGRTPTRSPGAEIGRGARDGADAGLSEPGDAGAAGRPDALVRGENYVIEPGALAEDRGPKAKATGNLAAINLAKRLTAEKRAATREEQDILARYVGWGGLSGAFQGFDGKYSAGLEDIGRDLKAALTPDEYKTAAQSTQYAHYTAENVIRSMWDAVKAMGFNGGSVFEPGMGVGHFLGLMPPDIAAASQYEGIELDHLTAEIAGHLYPRSGVRQANFTETPMPENTFDLVIGNPPFSDTIIKADKKYAAKNFMLHDYFFAKSLDTVRPGGLMAFVTSAGTMNKLNTDARNYLGERAEFLGGVRLPSDTFKKNAGTEVTTDILFFQKRAEPLSPPDFAAAPDASWTSTVQRELPNADGGKTKGNVSRYFSEHPEQVLGREGFFDKLYKGRYAVHAEPGADLTERMRQALDNLPKDIYRPPATPSEKAAMDFATTERKDGSFYVKDGQLMQYEGGVGRPVRKRGAGVEGGITAADMEKITRLIPIRDALREVFAHDLAERSQEAAVAREKLNRAYDAFTRKFGAINKAEFQYRRPNILQQEHARAEAREMARDRGQVWREGSFNGDLMEGVSASEISKMRQAERERLGAAFDEGSFNPAELPDIVIEKRPNIDPFMDDQESYRLRAIEDYNDTTHTSKKKRVFVESVLTREREPVLNSANDGVMWSLNKFGRFDVEAIAQKMNRDRASIIEELGDKVYKVPGSTDTYQTSDEYLSGDIIKKLDEARAAAQHDPDIRRNIPALEAAVPAPLPPSEITMSLGMPWIPPQLVEEYVRDRLRIGDARIRHNAALGGWTVSPITNGPETAVWGVEDMPAFKLLSAALNRQVPKIFKDVPDGNGGTTTILDADMTQAAQDKYSAMRNGFAEYADNSNVMVGGWLADNPDIAENLAGIYNNALNRSVNRVHDGAYLTTPGVSTEWSWRPHQRRVVSRIILTGNTHMAHAVGAGKTSAMIGAGMEMKRLGLVNKPSFSVPNHMLGQFTKEFYEQYPLAKIMVADERRFHTSRRKQFIASVAQSDIDAVVITHSALNMVPVSNALQAKLINEELDAISDALEGLDKQDDRITIKRLQNQKEKLEQRLKGALSSKKDQTNTFEEMGIDFLFVDEAHMFRKLAFATRQSGLKGVDPKGSQAAFELYAKIRYLESRRPGRSVVLASGTPITNTMAELFSISRYLQRGELKDRGIDHFDSWAATFGDTKQGLEQTPDGGYKTVTRFAKFVNIPELYKMVGQVMDIVTPAQLDQYVVRPKLKGGTRTLNTAPRTEFLDEYQADLARRMNEIKMRGGPPKKGDDIILSVIGDGRKAAIDPRFIMGPGANSEAMAKDSKLSMMIDNVFKIWERTKNVDFFDPKTNYQTKIASGPATQMIFSNLGVNPQEDEEGRVTNGFTTYGQIKKELLARGVPPTEIAFIQNYKSHVARQKLFNDMNEGKVRILIGSTQKMGTGVNAQRRLYAIHNLDPLWYPADDEQRVGRGLRQGNWNPEIEIHDYSTKGTYDSTMWQMMGRKARFIEQFFRGDPELRYMEDLGEASQYEQASAISTADPRVMELTDLRQNLDKALRREAAHDREQYTLRQKIKQSHDEIAAADRRIPVLKQDTAKRKLPPEGEFYIKIAGKNYAAVGESVEALRAYINEKWPTMAGGSDLRLGEYAGFPFFVHKSSYHLAEPGFFFEHSDGQAGDISGYTPQGAINSLRQRIAGFEQTITYLEKSRAEAETRIKAMESQIGKVFTGGEEIRRLRQEVHDLERALTPPKEEENKGAIKAQRPTLDQTQTPEFRNWFGDSKVVDEDGKPRIAYKAMEGTVPRLMPETGMTHVALDPEVAKQFAVQGHRPVQEVYVRSDRPFDYRNKADAGWLSQEMAKPENVAEFNRQTKELMGPDYDHEADANEIVGGIEDGAFQVMEVPLVINMIRARGYDSIFTAEEGDYWCQPNIAVFDPGQIKSAADNAGTFDPNNPDIRAQKPSVPFYSALTRSVEAINQQKAPAAQWSGIIDNLKTKGVKAEEIDGSGISAWLSEQNGEIDKATVLRRIKMADADKMYSDGASLRKIAEVMGTDHKMVSRWLDDFGTARRAYRKDEAVKADAVKQYLDGKSQEQIGSELGVSQAIIGHWLRAAGEDARGKPYDEAVIQEAVRLYRDEGLSSGDVGKKLSIPEVSAQKLIRGAGALRNRSEAGANRAIRKPTSSGRGKSAPYFSEKNRKWSFADSLLEIARMSQLDADLDVISWTKKVERVPYGDGKSYAPDFLIDHTDGTQSVEEVKPAHLVDDETVVAKADAARKHFSEKGIPYRIVTEDEIGRNYTRAIDQEKLRGFSEKWQQEGQPLFQKGAPDIWREIAGTRRLAPDFYARMPRIPSQGEAQLIEEVNKILKQIVPNAKIITAKELILSNKQVWGATYSDGGRAIIAWSMQSPDAIHTALHEAIHWLRNVGFFSPKEWETLVKAAKAGGWIEKHDIERRYPGEDEATKMEEAIAEESASWSRRQTTPPPEVRSLFGRLRDLLGRVAKYLRSLFGKNVTAEDIFKQVLSGEVGSREPMDKWKPDAQIFAQASKTPEGPPETPAEGRDYIDATTRDLAEHMRSQGLGTYERTLQNLKPPSGPEIFAKANWLQRTVAGPRTLAELDTKSGRFWAAIQREEDEAGKRLHDLRDHIQNTFLKLPQDGQDRVQSVMELDRLEGQTRTDTGRSIIARNTEFDDARGSRPGQTIVLTPEETKAYFGLQRMYRQAWDHIMEGSARRMGWQRPWSPAMADNLKAIQKAIDTADNQRNRKAFQRIHDVLTAMEEQRRQAYMPLMRFGDYYFSVTPKVDKDSTGGFPESVWFSLAERPSMSFADVDPMKMLRFETTLQGQVPDYAKKELAQLQARFDPKEYRINHGYLLNRADALRQMSIPAIEKLMMLLESGVLDRLKTEASMEGSANRGAAYKKAREDWTNLYEELVDAVRDEMYEQIKAGFKKRARTVAGYSPDFNRVLGSYMGWTSKHVAKQIHGDTIEGLYDDIQTSHPHESVRDFWKRWKQDDDSPMEPLSRAGVGLNQIGFLWTMAMNPASTISIALHGPTYAIPTLGTGIGVPKAAAAFTKAFGEATAAIHWGDHGPEINIAKLGRTPDERHVLKTMEASGYLHAKGAEDVRSMGAKASEIWGRYSPHAKHAMDIASSNIAVADQANRIAASLAAYRLARDGDLGRMNAVWAGNQMWRAISAEEGVSPESMAKFMLNQSVGEWGGRSRSRFGRNVVGRMGTALKGFVIRFLSNLAKQALRQGMPGRIAMMWSMAALWATAGLSGLPFVQDAENLIDEVWKVLTRHDPMIGWRMRAMLVDTGLGREGADFVLRGPLSVMSGMDFHSRLSLGDVITKDLAPLLGAAEESGMTIVSIVAGSLRAYELRKHSHQTAAQSLLPGGLRHPVQAAIDAKHGVKSQSGKRTYVPKSKFTGFDEAAEAAGFSPLDVARARDHAEFQYRAGHAHGSRPKDTVPR